MDNSMYVWSLSKNGREWKFVGTTLTVVLGLMIQPNVIKDYIYLKLEEVTLGDHDFKTVKVIRNTYEEAQAKQAEEQTQKEVDELEHMYHSGTDITH